MERKSRSELIKIIESQAEQLSRYETRLRDVVRAYKNLLKEKEALEASIKVLTTAQTAHSKHPKAAKKKQDQDSSPTEDGAKHKDFATLCEGHLTPTKQEKIDVKLSPMKEVKSHPLAVDGQVGVDKDPENQKDEDKEKTPSTKGEGETNEEEGNAQEEDSEEDEKDENPSDLDAKVMTLTSSLNTVMEQKTKMEANYQADKKKMMHDNEAKQKDMKEERHRLSSKIEELENQIKEFKLRMRQEQHAREEEESNHALMLRELQLLLSKERSAKEDIEQQLDDAKDKLESSKYFPESKVRHYEDCIAQLRKELRQVKERLQKSEDESSKPSPLLLKLQDEMAEMKREHNEAVIREQKRANDAEERLRLITSVEEDRVADLETKLSELSEVVGSYEKLRFHDQEVIHKLKERLQQLDCENTALSLHSPVRDGAPDSNIQTIEEIETLKDQVTKLRTVLKLAVERHPDNNSIEQELDGLGKSEIESILNSDPTHKACQQELRQLKDEFERYKAKTQSLHRNKSFKELTSQMENLDKMKTRNASLERRLKELHEESDQKEMEYNEIISRLRTELNDFEERYKREKEDSELLYRHKVGELEKQVVKQRERTLELIAEKDTELESLRAKAQGSSPSGVGSVAEVLTYSRKFMDHPVVMPREAEEAGAETEEGTASSPDTDAAVYQLLSRQSSTSTTEPGLLIHYAQQQARREAENSALRREKNELEDDLRECEMREAKMKDQCETLKEEIRKLGRDRSRESANLEYLKNIVLRFLVTTSYSVKEQLINAIATILQFSPKELTMVKKVHQGAWW